ncbi:hypothetical protein [Paenibacillus sp. MMS18-CY102]|uniref:hypothetical protein n=1 Tax=Paenibacillus sp. MMS18-CY102 TaxID=2682849 RepID=UPI001365CB4A|nr:hypothetical protein [Paenibacillus sp. MMS18-CY102]MWC26643.1 hypothetical protein [Paenibacillus sp. MMS18-CY102]
MEKREVYEREHVKLQEIFTDVDPSKSKLVEGLIEEAAFLRAENGVLRKTLVKTGMVKIHPSLPELQKPVEAARQYLKNLNSYAVVIKTLNGILQKNEPDYDDELDDFE